MSLRYALLALLTAGPQTGYDVAKRFAGSVGHVWHAPDSQIYPELRRMETDGLIDGEQVRWGPRSTKTLYHITDAGLESFQSWMGTPLSHAPERDAHHMQAAYFEWTEPDRARSILRGHLEYYTGHVALLTAIRDGIQNRTDSAVLRRLNARPDTEHERIIAFKVFSYSGMIARGEAEIDWARDGLELIDRLESSFPQPHHATAGHTN